MRRALKSLIITTATVAATTVTVGLTPAQGDGLTRYIAYGGGSFVYALNGIVTSGYTAPSALDTTVVPYHTTNSTLGANVGTAVSVRAIHTDMSSAFIPPIEGGGTESVATAGTGNIRLLNGLITATAIQTTAAAQLRDGIASGISGTSFVNLKIGGVIIPLNPAPNTKISIPNVATVTINAQRITPGVNADEVKVDAAGLIVTLLKGTVIMLDPVHAELSDAPEPIYPVGGSAYVTSVFATVGGVINVYSGPTAASALPGGGTGGHPRTNSTLGLNVAPIATARVASTTVNGLSSPGLSYANNSAEVASLHLLGNRISATTLKGTAAALWNGGPVILGESAQVLNLKVGTSVFSTFVAPNTVISIPGVAKVTINKQWETGGIAHITLLDIVLTTAGFGLPVGAEIKVGVATAWVTVPGCGECT